MANAYISEGLGKVSVDVCVGLVSANVKALNVSDDIQKVPVLLGLSFLDLFQTSYGLPEIMKRRTHKSDNLGFLRMTK